MHAVKSTGSTKLASFRPILDTQQRHRLDALKYCVGHRLRLARTSESDVVALGLLQRASHDAFVLMLAGVIGVPAFARIRAVLRNERLRRYRASIRPSRTS